ncbi:MAG: SDR family oxidoreductase [Cyclobacteriaceae bacterium]|nr:SDR family oxidoreductase [Cyclobacteriaceae bacterium]
MNLDLKGKNALVCGSTQGIGLASAQELALLGANVTLFARNKTSLEEAVVSLHRDGNQTHGYMVADFSDTQQVKNVVEKNNHFHILVNNTGGPPGGKAIDADINEFITAFSNHLINNQLLAQAIVPFMKSEGYGRIINIISTSVKTPIKGLGVSNTTRGAVASWAKTLANELGEFGITVNNVLPGSTNTQRIWDIVENNAKKLGVSASEVEAKMKAEVPAGRFAEPYEIAATVAFLATPAAAYINGINVPVDGGRTPSL